MAYLTYIFPVLIDVVVALVCFVNLVRLAQFKQDPATVAGVFTAINLIYMFSTLIVGRIVNTSNAVAIMLTGCALYLTLCISFMYVSSVQIMFVLVGATGLAGSMFFLPFQVFMKGNAQKSNSPLHASVGIYNMAWSFGFAIGPFIAGYLMEQGSSATAGGEKDGWRYAYAAAALLIIMTATGLILFSRRRRTPATTSAGGENVSSVYADMPDLSLPGWLVMAACAMVFYSSRGLLTSRFTNELHLQPGTQGILFFVASAAQSLTSLALSFSRTWMYRTIPVTAFPVAGAVGLVIFGTAENPVALYAAATLIGVYAGGSFCYCVFHSVVHPTKNALYVSINEAVLGASGAIMPLIAGFAATGIGFSRTFYCAAVLLLATMGMQIFFHRKIRLQNIHL